MEKSMKTYSPSFQIEVFDILEEKGLDKKVINILKNIETLYQDILEKMKTRKFDSHYEYDVVFNSYLLFKYCLLKACEDDLKSKDFNHEFFEIELESLLSIKEVIDIFIIFEGKTHLLEKR